MDSPATFVSLNVIVSSVIVVIGTVVMNTAPFASSRSAKGPEETRMSGVKVYPFVLVRLAALGVWSPQ